jgi:amidase
VPATHFLSREQSALAFSASLPPVLEIDPGDVVTFETGDAAYERLWKGEDPEAIEAEAYNAVTGPVLVRGAEPGDALRIDVLYTEVQRVWAVWSPGFGPLGRATDRLQVRPLSLADGQVRLSDRLAVPLEPMIGCIGLAPARGSSSTFAPAYPWGGNMDLRQVSPGATLFLPVQTRGGYLSVGDLHAAMGVGEPVWVSLESSGRATVRVELEKALRLKGPRLRVAGATLEVVVPRKKRGLKSARKRATRRAYRLLTRDWGLDPFEAYAYCCARVGVCFGGPASPIVLAVVPDPWDRRTQPRLPLGSRVST